MLTIVTAAIKQIFKDITISSFVKKQGADHYIFIINNTWVCKIPKEKEYQLKLASEVKLLQALQLKLSTRIPFVEYYDPEKHLFIYKKVPGVELTKELHNQWNKHEQKRLAHDLALFLHELHSALSPREIKQCAISPVSWPLSREEIQKNIPILSPDLKNIFDWFIDLYKPEESILVHNDMHAKNILINTKTRKLSGIIDFSDAGLGSYAHDFRYLYAFDTNFLHNLVQEYNSMSKQPVVDITHVYIFYLATEFSRYIKNPEARTQIQERIVNSSKIGINN